MYMQVKEPRLQARCRHSATAFTRGPGITVLLFGGYPEWPNDFRSDADVPQIANTTMLQFGEFIAYLSVD